MEYIEHGDLGKYIVEHNPTALAPEITSQILEGLIVLHERAICHRDLKPQVCLSIHAVVTLTLEQNILIASLAPIWVGVTDFGISKRWTGTSLHTHCGTNAYRSPEQLGFLPPAYRMPRGAYTNKIDMWAVGAIMHEMLTREIPFREMPADDEFDLTLPTVLGADQMVDTGLLYEFCQGIKRFPCGSLQSAGVADGGVDFVKDLMVVDPAKRLSAAAALANPWLRHARSVAQEAAPGPSLSTLDTVGQVERQRGTHRPGA